MYNSLNHLEVIIILDIKGVYHDVNPHWSTQKSKGLNTLVYVTEGKVIYYVDNKTLVLEEGDTLYIPHHMDRAWTSCPDESHKKFTAVFSWEEPASQSALLFPNKENLFHFHIRNAVYFEQRFSYLFVQWSSIRTLSEHLSNNVLQELLILISQENLEGGASSSKERIVRKLQEYILNHFRRNITIDELASIAEITPSYVTVLFKKVIGITPIQYLHHIRINTAVHLLQNTQMTIGEIAEYLGYCDQAYFNRMFKKWMGTAPIHAKS